MPKSGSIFSDWNLQFGQDKIEFPSYKFIYKSNYHKDLSYKFLSPHRRYIVYYVTKTHHKNYTHRRMGQVLFGWGGGGIKSLARIFFFHCLHENQVVLPEYYLISPPPPENGYLKNSRGLQPPPQFPWPVHLWLHKVMNVDLTISIHVT